MHPTLHLNRGPTSKKVQSFYLGINGHGTIGRAPIGKNCRGPGYILRWYRDSILSEQMFPIFGVKVSLFDLTEERFCGLGMN